MAIIEYVPEAEAKRRIEICKGNEDFYPCEKYFALTGNCKSCGCFLKAKTKIKTRGNHVERCPLNKW